MVDLSFSSEHFDLKVWRVLWVKKVLSESVLLQQRLGPTRRRLVCLFLKKTGDGGTTNGLSTLCLLVSCGQSKVIPAGQGSRGSSARHRGARKLL